MTDPDRAYFEYLRRRSWAGLAYRRLLLYPVLARELSGRVLDVGCGIGDFLAFRPATVGVDVNRITVAACRAKGLDARPMDPDVLPFDDRSFDGAVLDNVLEHLAEPRPLLREIARVLRPGGRLLVGVPGRRGFASDGDHKVFYDESALIETVEAAGFERRKVVHMPLRSGWLDRRLRLYCVYGVFVRP